MIITPKKFDAVLFDLDGVLTLTMKVHASAWKEMFDLYLQTRSTANGEKYQPFEIVTDYRSYVDGRLRYDGVRAFLASRNISLPEGAPEDPPSQETICGLGNRKDLLVQKIIATKGVDVLEGSVAVVRQVRALQMKTAVVSASKNCAAILQAAGIRELFDCTVDGTVAERFKLSGKPAPDTFLAAAKELDIVPKRAVVVEDSVSGVQAGRAGGFGLIIGIDHHGDKRPLLENGADVVVEDLAEILRADFRAERGKQG
ncbi:MAG: beta-phosphoglucomutase family hydrolase [Desulfuromonadales bacterium]|nr:beta-phosphoglucomutase family hydrolase [Desulfuromonadales bacterium]